MRRLLTILVILGLFWPGQGWAIDVRNSNETKPGFGTDTRAAYGGLESNTNITVTCTNATSKITGTGVATGLEVNDCFELTDSASNDSQIFMITTYTSADDVTVTPAPTDEGPTASVDIAQVPLFCVVDDITNNNGTPTNGTRGDHPVKLGSFRELCHLDNDNKIIMFEVSGTIPNSGTSQLSDIVLDDQYVSILGQTAPSPGVMLHHVQLRAAGEGDILIQHLRIRVTDTDNKSCISIGPAGSETLSNVVVDHCSVSGAYSDQSNLLVHDYVAGSCDNVTISNSISAEGYLKPGTSTKGMAFGWDVESVALIDSLITGNQIRNPQVYANKVAVVNNLFYNNGDSNVTIAGTGSRESDVSVVGNVNKGGPWDPSGSLPQKRIGQLHTLKTGSEVYFYDNTCDDTTSGDMGYTQSDASDWTRMDYTRTFLCCDGQSGCNSCGDAPIKVTAGSPTGTWPTGLTADAASGVHVAVLGNAGARPADRDEFDTDIMSDVINGEGISDNVSTEPTVQTLSENTRNLATGMAADGLNNLPSDFHGDADFDGYTDGEEWAHGLDNFVVTGAPPPVACGGTINNDWSGDTAVQARFEGENDFLDTTTNNNDLTGRIICNPTPTTLQDSYNSSIEVGYSTTVGYYTGQIVTKSGGYSDVCQLKFSVTAQGTPGTQGYTLYAQEWSVDGSNNLVAQQGGDLGSIACDDGWSVTEITISVASPVDIEQGNAIVLTLKTSDTTNYVKAHYLSSSDETTDLGQVRRWRSALSLYDSTNYDLYIKVYEQLANSPDFNTTSPLKDTYDIDFESGSTHGLVLADGDASANMMGKNGTTNRTGSWPQRIDVESFPSSGNFMALNYKKNQWEFGIYNDGGTPKLRLILYDATPTAYTYTHASEVTTGHKAVMWAWDHASNTAYIDMASCSGDVWSRVGTRIASTANDFTPNITANDYHFGYGDDAEYFDGNWDECVGTNDIISATQFMDYASGQYGDPPPSLSSMTGASATHTAAGSITMTSAFDETEQHAGIPVCFDCSIDYGGPVTFCYSAANTWSATIVAGQRGQLIMSSTYFDVGDTLSSWTGPDGNSEYYAACPSGEPFTVYSDATALTEGTVGSLSTGEWGWDGTNIRVYTKDDLSGNTVQACYGKITDAQGEFADISTVALTNPDTLAVPKLASAPWRIGVDYPDINSLFNATSPVAGDYIVLTQDIVENINTPASGVSTQRITLDGRNYTITGNVTIDEDRWILRHVRINGNLTVSGGHSILYNTSRMVSGTRTDTGTGNAWYLEHSDMSMMNGRRVTDDSP